MIGLMDGAWSLQHSLRQINPSGEPDLWQSEGMRLSAQGCISCIFRSMGLILLCAGLCAGLSSATLHSQQAAPNDYHQHLLSPAVARLVGAPKPFAAADLIPLMDAAGVRRAVILSLAYQFGNPNRPALPDEYEQVKQENDWTAAQAAEYPGRFVVFCGVDPLKDLRSLRLKGVRTIQI